MTDLKGQHISTIALGFLLLASTAKTANAQIRIDKDQTGRIVAMANLSTASGCSRASGRGRVVDQHFENGQMKGVTFKDAKYGESYLNLPLLATISPASARARVAEGFATLLAKGQELKVVTLGCGAAGRIEKLASVELVGPPVRATGAVARSGAVRSPAAAAAAASPDTGVRSQDGDDSVLRAQDGQAIESSAPAPAPPGAQPHADAQTSPDLPRPQTPTPARRSSRWRFGQMIKTELHFEIDSNDSAFSFNLTCGRADNGITISHWFLPPRNWNIVKSATPVSIDGRPLRWEVDGADEGLIFSDNHGGNMSSLSAGALDQLARGERFVVHGRTSRGKPRDAIFDISGGEQAFAAFEARCKKLPRR
ncbi:hypothetical protein [Bosea sp. NPDC055594]